jgi:hypothetical protein
MLFIVIDSQLILIVILVNHVLRVVHTHIPSSHLVHLLLDFIHLRILLSELLIVVAILIEELHHWLVYDDALSQLEERWKEEDAVFHG